MSLCTFELFHTMEGNIYVPLMRAQECALGNYPNIPMTPRCRCVSTRGCEAVKLVAQASAGYKNLSGCPSRSDVRGTCAAKPARGCGDAGNRKERLHWA